MIDLIRREPALVVALVNAALGCAVVFGLDLTDVQVAAILAVVNAALGIVVRSQVTPTVKLANPQGWDKPPRPQA